MEWISEAIQRQRHKDRDTERGVGLKRLKLPYLSPRMTINQNLYSIPSRGTPYQGQAEKRQSSAVGETENRHLLGGTCDQRDITDYGKPWRIWIEVDTRCYVIILLLDYRLVIWLLQKVCLAFVLLQINIL